MAGGHFLPGNHEQSVGDTAGPFPVGGAGVVIRGDDEVQSRGLRGCKHLTGFGAAVGVDGMDM